MKNILMFLIITFISVSLFSQPKDIKGWENTKWGMSADDVLKNFDKSVKLAVKKQFMRKYSPVGINNIEMDSCKYEVYFLFNEGVDSLAQINLFLVSSVSKKDIVGKYRSLIENLKKGFGKPTREKDRKRENIEDRGTLWITPNSFVIVQCMVGNSDRIFMMFIKKDHRTPETLGFKEEDIPKK